MTIDSTKALPTRCGQLEKVLARRRRSRPASAPTRWHYLCDDGWQWLCGFYPGSDPGEQRGGTTETFDGARAAFETARDYVRRKICELKASGQR
jgi:hypothetical protein